MEPHQSPAERTKGPLDWLVETDQFVALGRIDDEAVFMGFKPATALSRR